MSTPQSNREILATGSLPIAVPDRAYKSKQPGGGLYITRSPAHPIVRQLLLPFRYGSRRPGRAGLLHLFLQVRNVRFRQLTQPR